MSGVYRESVDHAIRTEFCYTAVKGVASCVCEGVCVCDYCGQCETLVCISTGTGACLGVVLMVSAYVPRPCSMKDFQHRVTHDLGSAKDASALCVRMFFCFGPRGVSGHIGNSDRHAPGD